MEAERFNPKMKSHWVLRDKDGNVKDEWTVDENDNEIVHDKDQTIMEEKIR